MRRACVEGPSLCCFVLLQLQEFPWKFPLEEFPWKFPLQEFRWKRARPLATEDCSLGSGATWWGRTPPASGRLVPGPDGRREASGVLAGAPGLKAAGGRPRKWRERPPL